MTKLANLSTAQKLASIAAALVTVIGGLFGGLIWVIGNELNAHDAEQERRDRHLLVLINLGRCDAQGLGPLDCDTLEGHWDREDDSE